MVKNPPASEGDTGDMSFIPELKRFPGERNDNPLQCSCLENLMARGAWWDTIHGVAKNQTRLTLSLSSRGVLPEVGTRELGTWEVESC